MSAVEESVSATDDSPEVRPPSPKKRRTFRRTKRVTVAVVPPPSATDVWDALTKARTLLNDPLFHRWPPHANLLYPFLALRDQEGPSNDDDDGDSDEVEGGLFEARMLRALERAASRVEPFDVSLSNGEAFGGSDRGVVWLYPRSYGVGEEEKARKCDEEGSSSFLCADLSEPLIRLHASLEESFPMLVDPRERRGGKFHPHVTLGNYHSLSDAQAALVKLKSWWEKKTFRVEEFYVLRRVGDDGQFHIAATIPLGKAGAGEGRRRAVVHDPPLRFPGMPAEEEGWVREERAKFEQWTEERKARLKAQKLKAASDGVVVIPEIPDRCPDENGDDQEETGKMDGHMFFRRTRMRHRRSKSRRRR